VLRARLRECESCDITVKADAASILGGGVQGVQVKGRRWCTPMRLSCNGLLVDVGQTAVDLPALATQRRIVLKQPARGRASIHFSASDWDNFLVHPSMIAAVAERRKSSAAPVVQFDRGGGTRLLTDDAGGAICFPVLWDGARLVARLSQPTGGVSCTAQPHSPQAADSPAAAAAALDASASAGPWLRELFTQLVLDLDGCALSFRALRVEPARGAASAELVLDLDVCVTSFPSLDINF